MRKRVTAAVAVVTLGAGVALVVGREQEDRSGCVRQNLSRGLMCMRQPRPATRVAPAFDGDPGDLIRYPAGEAVDLSTCERVRCVVSLGEEARSAP
jgi:hypothetical protein